jgi:hypothetical protein
MRNLTFRDMRSAPQDGTAVDVLYGSDDLVALARWRWQSKAWVRYDDPHCSILHRVTGWRPVNIERTTKPMTADDFESRLELLIGEGRAEGLSDEVLGIKLQDAADALREGMS